MMPDPPGKSEPAFPCHKLTALEINSIVVSSKYLTDSEIITHNLWNKHRLLVYHKAFCARAKRRQNALWRMTAAGSNKPGALDS